MRIVIWHGYLLDGTGSNVYSRSLARTWSRQGHDVVVVCQEPEPERFDLGGARVVRPRLDGPLPVFVLDSYRDMVPMLLPDMSPTDRDRFVDVNARALRDELPADVLLCNHVLLGAPVGAATEAPFMVKAHGSELEYAMRGNAELSEWARKTVASARAVIAGSDHIVRVLDEVVGAGQHSSRVHVIPPGVDVDDLRPQDRESALQALIEQSRLDRAMGAWHEQRGPKEGNADRFAAFLAGDEPTVLYVGKVSAEKGVPLLLEAVESMDVRTVIVGFGPERERLQAQIRGRVLFTGTLQHRHLAHLWPLADVAVTPSIFPEAFGMVAAEAAACGCPPLVARHSGLAEIAERIAAAYPPRHRHLTAFHSGDVDDLRAKLSELLSLPRKQWHVLSQAARRAAVDCWSWDSVADRITALATGAPS